MKKQLSMSDIDPLITKLEQSYSDTSHLVNALSDEHALTLPSAYIKLLAYVFEADTATERDNRLQQVVSELDESERCSFVQALSSSLKLQAGRNSEDIEKEGVVNIAKQLLATNDFEVNESTLAFKVLLSKLTASSQLQQEMFNSVVAGDGISERELKQLIPQASNAVIPDASAESGVESGPLFSEVYAEFLEHKIKKEKLSDKMQKYYDQYNTIWSLIAEDKPIESYTNKDIGKFVDRCFELPKFNISPYNKMSWEERVKVDVPDEDIASPKTAHQYYKWLQGVFAYAKSDTVGYIAASPCTIKRNFKGRTRGIYSNDELTKFIKAASKPDKEWQRWVVLLGIYTGARRGEIAQLRKQDIKLDKATGRHYILVTDQGSEQKVKTENARRMIPVHKVLIDAGFIDFVESKADKLFDELYSREAITNWFIRHLIALGIPNENELGHKRSFHSFRHTFITTLMNKGVSVNLLQQVVGHEISSFGITSNYTHKSTEIEPLLVIIDSFEI